MTRSPPLIILIPREEVHPLSVYKLLAEIQTLKRCSRVIKSVVIQNREADDEDRSLQDIPYDSSIWQSFHGQESNRGERMETDADNSFNLMEKKHSDKTVWDGKKTKNSAANYNWEVVNVTNFFERNPGMEGTLVEQNYPCYDIEKVKYCNSDIKEESYCNLKSELISVIKSSERKEDMFQQISSIATLYDHTCCIPPRDRFEKNYSNLRSEHDGGRSEKKILKEESQICHDELKLVDEKNINEEKYNASLSTIEDKFIFDQHLTEQILLEENQEVSQKNIRTDFETFSIISSYLQQQTSIKQEDSLYKSNIFETPHNCSSFDLADEMKILLTEIVDGIDQEIPLAISDSGMSLEEFTFISSTFNRSRVNFQRNCILLQKVEFDSSISHVNKDLRLLSSKPSSQNGLNVSTNSISDVEDAEENVTLKIMDYPHLSPSSDDYVSAPSTSESMMSEYDQLLFDSINRPEQDLPSNDQAKAAPEMEFLDMRCRGMDSSSSDDGMGGYELEFTTEQVTSSAQAERKRGNRKGNAKMFKCLKCPRRRRLICHSVSVTAFHVINHLLGNNKFLSCLHCEFSSNFETNMCKRHMFRMHRIRNAQIGIDYRGNWDIVDMEAIRTFCNSYIRGNADLIMELVEMRRMKT